MPNVQHAELLPIVVQDNTALVDARLLHQRLKVGTIFVNWIKRRIEDYHFKQGEDYFPTLEKSKTKPVTVFLLTLDMAKELAMLERNEVGRQVRRYFIAKEKELRGINLPQLPKVNTLFTGIKPHKINNRRLFPYKEMLNRIGYSTKSSTSDRRSRYPGHFVEIGNLLYITEEFTLHLYHRKQVVANRVVIKSMQPVLALNFGEGGSI